MKGIICQLCNIYRNCAGCNTTTDTMLLLLLLRNHTDAFQPMSVAGLITFNQPMTANVPAIILGIKIVLPV